MIGGITPAAAQTPPQDDPDLDVNFAQPDFTLVALPTTLRVPRHKSAFRVTHRFTPSAGRGRFRQPRRGSVRPRQRRADRPRVSIRPHARHADRLPPHVDSHDRVLRAARGDGAGRGDSRSRFDALAIDRRHEQFPRQLLARRSARSSRGRSANTPRSTCEPIWVNNSNAAAVRARRRQRHRDRGLGARLRVRPTVYLVLEGAPRVAGYDPGSTQISFGLEKRSGGHMFQLTITNGFGTTMGQIARGASNTDDWHLGFSISRKFF